MPHELRTIAMTARCDSNRRREDYSPDYFAPLHRYRACIHHPDWAEWQRRLIRIVAEVGHVVQSTPSSRLEARKHAAIRWPYDCFFRRPRPDSIIGRDAIEPERAAN
jgi:hypothetical protein